MPLFLDMIKINLEIRLANYLDEDVIIEVFEKDKLKKEWIDYAIEELKETFPELERGPITIFPSETWDMVPEVLYLVEEHPGQPLVLFALVDENIRLPTSNVAQLLLGCGKCEADIFAYSSEAAANDISEEKH